MCGFIAQLVEHRTGIVEVMGSNPVEALIFFRLLLSNCLNWKIYCDDLTSLTDYCQSLQFLWVCCSQDWWRAKINFVFRLNLLPNTILHMVVTCTHCLAKQCVKLSHQHRAGQYPTDASPVFLDFFEVNDHLVPFSNVCTSCLPNLL